MVGPAIDTFARGCDACLRAVASRACQFPYPPITWRMLQGRTLAPQTPQRRLPFMGTNVTIAGSTSTSSLSPSSPKSDDYASRRSFQLSAPRTCGLGGDEVFRADFY